MYTEQVTPRGVLNKLEELDDIMNYRGKWGVMMIHKGTGRSAVGVQRFHTEEYAQKTIDETPESMLVNWTNLKQLGLPKGLNIMVGDLTLFPVPTGEHE